MAGSERTVDDLEPDERTLDELEPEIEDPESLLDERTYTRETGDGYHGRYATSCGSTTISILSTDLDWSRGTTVFAVPVDDGIRLQPEGDDSAISRYKVKGRHGPNVSLSGDALRAVVEPGDDVRVYECPESLLVVPADDDPRVRADGGQDVDVCRSTPDEHGSPTYMTDGGEDLRAVEKEVTVAREGDDVFIVAREPSEDESQVIILRSEDAEGLHEKLGFVLEKDDFDSEPMTDGGLVDQWPSADQVVTVSNGGDSATVPADAEAVVVTDGIDATSYHRPQHDDVIATACNPERGALRIARDAAEAMGLHACTHHCCYGSQEVGR